MRQRKAYNRESALLSVGDGQAVWARVALGASSSLSSERGFSPQTPRASALGDDADRIRVARLTTPFNRGLSLAFPRRPISESGEAILSVEHNAIRKPMLRLPATWSAVTAFTVHRGTVVAPARSPRRNGTRCLTTSARTGPALRHFGLTLAPPPNGGTWRVTPVNRTPKESQRNLLDYR